VIIYQSLFDKIANIFIHYVAVVVVVAYAFSVRKMQVQSDW